jgi:hypothetical protein
MPLLSREELKTIATTPQPLCVSIFMPTQQAELPLAFGV